jgi:hypothetical protein
MQIDELKSRLADLRCFMKVARIEELRVEFDGSGDSGEIIGLTADSALRAEKLPKVAVEAIDDMADEVLSMAGYDYCNDDGGYGEVIFTQRAVLVEFSQRVTQTEHHEYTLPESLLE